MQPRSDEWPYCTDESAGGQQGKLLVPGIYDTVAKLTPEEEKLYDAIDFDMVMTYSDTAWTGPRPEPGPIIMPKYGYRYKLQSKNIHVQEYIPIGCVSPASVAISIGGGCLPGGGGCPGGVVSAWGGVCSGDVSVQGACVQEGVWLRGWLPGAGCFQGGFTLPILSWSLWSSVWTNHKSSVSRYKEVHGVCL